MCSLCNSPLRPTEYKIVLGCDSDGVLDAAHANCVLASDIPIGEEDAARLYMIAEQEAAHLR